MVLKASIPTPRSLLASLSRTELERIIRERLDEGDAELGELILIDDAYRD